MLRREARTTREARISGSLGERLFEASVVLRSPSTVSACAPCGGPGASREARCAVPVSVLVASPVRSDQAESQLSFSREPGEGFAS